MAKVKKPKQQPDKPAPQKRGKKQAEAPPAPRLVWGLEPSFHKNGWADVNRWEGTDGKFVYRVERVLQTLGADDGFPHSFVAWRRDQIKKHWDYRGRRLAEPELAEIWFPVEREKSAQGHHPRRYRSLEAALQACETHFVAADPKAVGGNTREVLEAAEAKGLASVPARSTSVGRPRGEGDLPGVRSRLAVEGPSPGPSQPPGRSGGGRGVRYELLGHPVTAVLRWMGANGFTYPQAVNALVKLQVPCADNTVRIQLAAGKRGERGEPAPLSAEQAAQLKEAAK